MGLYRRYVLPWAIHRACSGEPTSQQRARVVPEARGRVLEVGIGSGLNLPYYESDRVSEVVGLDPSEELLRMAARAADATSLAVSLLPGRAEEIPLDDESVDTVVLTYTLCSIPDPETALREIGRVVRPGGRLLFCEHGLAPDPGVRRWQRWLNPLWRRISGGCHLNRDIPGILRGGGFTIESLDTLYTPQWRPAAFNYLGSAVVR